MSVKFPMASQNSGYRATIEGLSRLKSQAMDAAVRISQPDSDLSHVQVTECVHELTRVLNRITRIEGFFRYLDHLWWPESENEKFTSELAEDFMAPLLSFDRDMRQLSIYVDASSPHRLKTAVDGEDVATMMGLNEYSQALERTVDSIIRAYDQLTAACYPHDMGSSFGPQALRTYWEDADEVRNVVSDTILARDQARAALEATRTAAGEVGDVVLSVHFAKYATDEKRRAVILQIGTTACLLAIAVVAALLLWRDHLEPGNSIFAALAKLSVSIPLAVLAAYFARESTKHFESARWASEIAVQLLTVDAYIAPIASDMGADIKRDLASRVFSQRHPQSSDDRTLLELVERMRQLVEVFRGK